MARVLRTNMNGESCGVCWGVIWGVLRTYAEGATKGLQIHFFNASKTFKCGIDVIWGRGTCLFLNKFRYWLKSMTWSSPLPRSLIIYLICLSVGALMYIRLGVLGHASPPQACPRAHLTLGHLGMVLLSPQAWSTVVFPPQAISRYAPVKGCKWGAIV